MISSALSIAVSALRAHTYAVETTSHNIANAATPGYRRQRVELKPAYPRESGLGSMGAGVEAARITRATDRLADLRTRGASAQSAMFGTRAQLLQKAEDVVGEPDHGITTELAGVWNAFATLAVAPTDNAARYQVLSSLQATADRINEIRNGLDQLGADATQRLVSDVGEANDIIDRLVELNRVARGPNGLAADLSDERDRAVDQLAASLGAVASIDDDGQVRLTLNGLAIVDDDRGVHLSVTLGPPPSVDHPTGPIAVGGTAGGLLAAVATDLADARANLDTFVTGLVTALNTTHATGFTPSGGAGGALLSDVGGVVTVVPTQPGDIAAANAAGEPQNGRVADALAQLRNTQGSAYRSVVTALSGRVAAAGRSADTAASVAEAAATDRDGLTGVNLDEEMTDLMSQQRAYQAAARLVTVIDDMLNSLIQM